MLTSMDGCSLWLQSVTVAPLVLVCADLDRLKALMEQVRSSSVLCWQHRCTWGAASTHRGGLMQRPGTLLVSLNVFGCPGSIATPRVLAWGTSVSVGLLALVLL